MKIVAMCQAGTVRSGALKHLLRYKYGHDAISCGWEGNSPQTREMLFRWADYIVIMQSKFEKHIPEEFKKNQDGSQKLFCYDVGEDVYGNPLNGHLLALCDKLIKKHGVFNK